MTSPHVSTLVIVPTYNEIENIAIQVALLLESPVDLNVLIVDDNSPDGTGRLADELAADSRVFVLHRQGKAGLGSAYVAGFRWALERGYEFVVEMDADGSHPASALPDLLLAVNRSADLVIGSRWVPGGKVVDWPRSREILSRAANAYARAMLRLRARDVTGGYRAYRSAALRSIPLHEVRSRGYCFQVDMTVRVTDAGFTVAEVPITFKDRRAGTSKMTWTIVIEAMVFVTVWGVRRLLKPSNLGARTVAEKPRSDIGV